MIITVTVLGGLVHQRSIGSKRYHHPLVGDLTITYQALTPGDDSDQTIMVYDTEPGSSSVHALQLLAEKIPEHTPYDANRRTRVAPEDPAQRSDF
jgi:hypothetical protein